MSKKIFAENLKRIRTAKGLSQTDLAGLTGLSQASISNMERGEKMTSLKTLLKLSGVLGCKIDDLVDFNSNEAVEN